MPKRRIGSQGSLYTIEEQRSFFGIFDYWTVVGRELYLSRIKEALADLVEIDAINAEQEKKWEQKSSTSKTTKPPTETST